MNQKENFFLYGQKKYQKRIKNINSDSNNKNNRKININLDRSLQNSKNIFDNINSKSEVMMPSLTNYSFKHKFITMYNINF